MGVVAAVILVLLVYTKNMQKPRIEDDETSLTSKPETKNKKTGKAEELLGFRKIDQGVITLEDGRSLRAVIGVDAINYHSLSDSEQEAVDGAMAGVLASLSFSIQLITLTSPVDLQDYIRELKHITQSLPKALQIYAQAHIHYLHEETRQEILIKKDYLVVGVDEMEEPKQAINELDRRCGLIISGLRRAGHIARVLDTQAVSDIFYDIFHSNRVLNARLKDALGHEFTSFAVQSEKPAHPLVGKMEDDESEQQLESRKRLVMLK